MSLKNFKILFYFIFFLFVNNLIYSNNYLFYDEFKESPLDNKIDKYIIVEDYPSEGFTYSYTRSELEFVSVGFNSSTGVYSKPIILAKQVEPIDLRKNSITLECSFTLFTVENSYDFNPNRFEVGLFSNLLHLTKEAEQFGFSFAVSGGNVRNLGVESFDSTREISYYHRNYKESILNIEKEKKIISLPMSTVNAISSISLDVRIISVPFGSMTSNGYESYNFKIEYKEKKDDYYKTLSDYTYSGFSLIEDRYINYIAVGDISTLSKYTGTSRGKIEKLSLQISGPNFKNYSPVFIKPLKEKNNIDTLNLKDDKFYSLSSYFKLLVSENKFQSYDELFFFFGQTTDFSKTKSNSYQWLERIGVSCKIQKMATGYIRPKYRLAYLDKDDKIYFVDDDIYDDDGASFLDTWDDISIEDKKNSDGDIVLRDENDIYSILYANKSNLKVSKFFSLSDRFVFSNIISTNKIDSEGEKLVINPKKGYMLFEDGDWFKLGFTFKFKKHTNAKHYFIGVCNISDNISEIVNGIYIDGMQLENHNNITNWTGDKNFRAIIYNVEDVEFSRALDGITFYDQW